MLRIETGGLAHIAAAAAGVPAILATSAAAVTAIKYLGAAYLIYLGVRRLLGSAETVDGVPASTSTARVFEQGVVIQVLNPKTAMFFLLLATVHRPRTR